MRSLPCDPTWLACHATCRDHKSDNVFSVQFTTKLRSALSRLDTYPHRVLLKEDNMATENVQSKQTRIDRLKAHIPTVPDFPKPGILFWDIMPIMQNPEVFSDSVALLEEHIKEAGIKVDVVVGLEARGFLFGPLLALRLNCAFVPVRKAGKLPGETVKCSYTLEYGKDTVEAQKNSIKPNQNVLIFDDLIATGGTMAGACQLMESMQANIVECLAIVELDDLKGREKISKYSVHSLIHC